LLHNFLLILLVIRLDRNLLRQIQILLFYFWVRLLFVSFFFIWVIRVIIILTTSINFLLPKFLGLLTSMLSSVVISRWVFLVFVSLLVVTPASLSVSASFSLYSATGLLFLISVVSVSLVILSVSAVIPLIISILISVILCFFFIIISGVFSTMTYASFPFWRFRILFSFISFFEICSFFPFREPFFS